MRGGTHLFETLKMIPEKMTLGQKAADKIASIVGSWTFIITQSVILMIWIILNVVAWIYHWDPYPFILLNLALSFQAAYTAPIILMSQNRTAEKDRRKASMDLYTDKRAESEIEEIQQQLKHIGSMIGEIARNGRHGK
ncbi:MAG: hypothetical protein UY41_C0009G0046 [Candidatus Moranbacteria bacterium GW2011_GWE1_49_15]|nr:MAG: hypothetical protein UX75_C0029G0008 [Candidatus Moranbacteria bacterium GW2011_GWE2_47_10]KKW07107.1 MAG: hypothetical protein UY41_C0009G0046 [Candidatus Moranbacteria bacterium GW2011_GWE1_49_15]HBP01108.1 hypothetical protein [Candidatus Moranbacteria bacterium]